MAAKLVLVGGLGGMMGGMSEILLVRHSKSFANVRDMAFGNVESPLNPEGEIQAAALNAVFREEYGIEPELYEEPVAASEFTRTQQTARMAGFRLVKIEPITNETEVPRELLQGRLILEKHVREGWIPDELHQRAQRFLELVRRGELGYQIYFAHGFFIASVLAEVSNEHLARQQESPHRFDQRRGYIPRLSTVNLVSV